MAVNDARAVRPAYLTATLAKVGRKLGLDPGIARSKSRDLLIQLVEQTSREQEIRNDDETLGVGGTLALHAEAGSEIMVVIMSEGEEEKLEHTPRCETLRFVWRSWRGLWLAGCFAPSSWSCSSSRPCSEPRR